MKGLVFGKTGQVARSLAERLRALESTVFLDRQQADLSRPELLGQAIEALEPDVVVNAAAYTAVDQAESEPELAELINTRAPAAMAEACARTGAWLVHYSTDYVFDGAATIPYREDDPVAPASVYGRTKLAGERAIVEAHDRYLILRTSWVYSNHGRNFLNTMLRLAAERKEMGIVSDQIGAPTWAGSIASATDKILHLLASERADNDGKAGIYNMTCAGRTSWYGFACEIFQQAGMAGAVTVNPISTAEYPTPAARPPYSVLSNDKLERELGVVLVQWEDALRQCLSERTDSE